MEPSHIDGPWLDDPSRLWPHISMQNPASAESNRWKQIRKIQWWTNRWKTSEMPPNVSCRHCFCLSFFCLNFGDYLVQTWIRPSSRILPPLWHWRKNRFIVFEHLKSAKSWISFLFAKTMYDIWLIWHTQLKAPGTPTGALVDLTVPSCQPQRFQWITVFMFQRKSRKSVVSWVSCIILIILSQSLIGWLLKVGFGLLDEHGNLMRYQALQVDTFSPDLCWAPQTNCAISCPFTGKAWHIPKLSGLARVKQMFLFFQYCMTKEMKPKQIPQDVQSSLIFMIYYVSLSVKASAPLTVKAPSTNSAPLLPLLGASRVGNLDDGTPQLQYPATIHEVLEEGRPYKSCSII